METTKRYILWLQNDLDTKGRVKKKLEISNRGCGSEKKNPTFPKTVSFYLECHDSARNVIKDFCLYVTPPPPTTAAVLN